MSTKDTFESKAKTYASARPPWQDVDVNHLLTQTGFSEDDLTGIVIVDVGAGGGFLTEHFTNRGATVIAVEPNEAMRNTMLEKLGSNDNLIITDGDAGDLKIPRKFEGKVDLIVSGNSHHWWGKHAPKNTDPNPEKDIATSWAKVAKPEAKVAIAFNKMNEDAPEVARLQEIGVSHFPITMGSPFAPAKRAPFTLDQFADYFEGRGDEYHREYDMVFSDFENFTTWLISHSYIPNDIFSDQDAATELRELYESLPEGSEGKKLWPYRVSVYTGDLTPLPQ